MFYIASVIFPLWCHPEEICAPHYSSTGNQGSCGRRTIHIYHHIFCVIYFPVEKACLKLKELWLPLKCSNGQKSHYFNRSILRPNP